MSGHAATALFLPRDRGRFENLTISRSENLFFRVNGNLRFPLTFTYHGCPRNSHETLHETLERVMARSRVVRHNKKGAELWQVLTGLNVPPSRAFQVKSDYTPNAPAANINYTLCLNAGSAVVRDTDGTTSDNRQRMKSHQSVSRATHPPKLGPR